MNLVEMCLKWKEEVLFIDPKLELKGNGECLEIEIIKQP